MGALGACFGRVVSMDSPRARPPGDFSWQATLWHEIAHVFTLQLSNYRVPRWLTEGISVYEEHRRAGVGPRADARVRASARQGQDVRREEAARRVQAARELALAYFEASLVVEHLVALNGEAGLRTLLLAYADGAKDAEAFAKAFGRSVDDVDASFKAFIDQRYGALSARDGRSAAPGATGRHRPACARARREAPGNFLSQLALGQAL